MDMTMEGDWSLTLTGTVIAVDAIDVDKTGRNRKVFYEFSVRPDSLQGVPEGAELQEVLKIRIKDRDFSRLCKNGLNAGDCVTMTVMTNGPRPTLFYLKAVSKQAAR